MYNSCVYGRAMVGRRGWQRWEESLSSDRPCWRSGGDTVVQNCKPDQTKGVSYFVGGGDKGG